MTGQARAAILVVAPGLATTIQDRGRPGWQRLGVPVSGALDVQALAAANVVVGNSPGEAALECLYQGCELVVEADSVRVAAAGAGVTLEIVEGSGKVSARIEALESAMLLRGQRVRVRIGGLSMSAYLAVEGGIAVPTVLGSRSTYSRAALGGISGRALRSGDVVPLGQPIASSRAEMRLPGVVLAPATEVRVVLGPQHDRFTSEAREVLANAFYRVLPASDRMGLRLSGARLAHTAGADILSDGIPPGAIQVPGDGLPIIMLADRQTTGGYTKIATVISADLPALGRIGPGAGLRFRVVIIEEAEALARAQAVEIAGWPQRLVRSRPHWRCARAALRRQPDQWCRRWWGAINRRAGRWRVAGRGALDDGGNSCLPLAKPAAIGVSTKPGLTMTACLPTRT